MEGIIDDAFFSETIVHNYPTDETENLTVIWTGPESGGINDEFDSSLPSFEMKTSDNGNIDRVDSRFVRNSKTYKIQSIYPDQSGITKIIVREIDA